jgi:hypothetical protein
MIDSKKLKRIKNRVLKLYPKSKLVMVNGRYHISDGEGNKLHAEYMIPPQKSVILAWYWFNEIIKTDKNIQRTHPDRMSSADFEKKFNRISKRNRKK